MPDNAYKPAGYCPHCGYAIDPGTCPECGKTVAADKLDSTPYSITRRRLVKRVMLVLIILCLVVGGWYAYTRCNWIAWTPTRLLLALRGNDYSRWNKELWRRFDAGALSAEQANRLFCGAVRVPHGPVIRSPHPAGLGVQTGLTIEIAVFAQPCVIRCIDHQTTVDGQLMKGAGSLAGTGGGTGCLWTCDYHVWMPGLTAGPHEVQTVLTFGLVRGTRFPDNAPPLHTTTLKFTNSVLVEDRPIDSHVRQVWQPGFEQLKAVRLCLTGAGTETIRKAWLEFGDISIPIAARLEVRRPGSTGYRPAAEPSANDPLAGTVSCPAGKTRSDCIDWFVGRDAVSSRTFDVRLVPDARAAWYAGFTTYFGGTIEWSGVQIDTIPLNTRPFRPAPEAFLKPTRVYSAATTGVSE